MSYSERIRELAVEVHKTCCPLCNKWRPSEYSGPCGFEETQEEESWKSGTINGYFFHMAKRISKMASDMGMREEKIMDILQQIGVGKEKRHGIIELFKEYGFNENGGISQ